jgi:hypothetical protein
LTKLGWEVLIFYVRGGFDTDPGRHEKNQEGSDGLRAAWEMTFNPNIRWLVTFPTQANLSILWFFHIKNGSELGVGLHICNPSTWKAEAGGSWVPGQPRLHSKTLSQKNTKTNKKLLSFGSEDEGNKLFWHRNYAYLCKSKKSGYLGNL